MQRVVKRLAPIPLLLGLGVGGTQEPEQSDVWTAASKGDLETLAGLVDQGANINEPHSTSQLTPLTAAVLTGQETSAAWILDNGGAVDARNSNGSTALHAAVFLGSAPIAKLLLNAGADALADDFEGTSAFDLVELDWSTTANFAAMLQIELEETAVMEGRTEVRVLLESSLTKRASSDIRVAIYIGDIAAVSKHLANGADPDAPIDAEGTTPLVYAVTFEHSEVVRSLLAAGAKVNAPGGSGGATALHAAVFAGRAEIARMLLDAGADPNTPDYSGSLPRDAAMLDWPTTAYLGAMIGIELSEGAVREGRSKIIQWLRAVPESKKATED